MKEILKLLSKTNIDFIKQNLLEQKIFPELWLPTKTDWQDSTSICLNYSVNNLMSKFWFTIKQLYHPNKNLLITSPQSFISSQANFTNSEDTLLKSRKIRIYPTAEQKKILKQMLRSLGELYFSEKVDFRPDADCRLVNQDGRYYLIIPIKSNIKQVSPDSQRHSLVALDPGVRTFLTAYDSDKVFKVGEHDFKIIYKILLQLDRTISKKSLTKGSKNKRIYNRLISNYKFRVKNLVKEMYNQTAIMLVKNYDEILLPEFKSSKMVVKLHSKTCRSLLTWSHFSFKQHLIFKAKEYSSKVTIVNEAYTSKTCSNCMTVNNIGAKEYWKCKLCGFEHDRDISASRNIYILGAGRFAPKQLGIVND